MCRTQNCGKGVVCPENSDKVFDTVIRDHTLLPFHPTNLHPYLSSPVLSSMYTPSCSFHFCAGLFMGLVSVCPFSPG